jgi:sulfate transport system ATP-binding protein
VYDRPSSPFVFSFIGESTQLPVEIREGAVLFQGEPLGIADAGSGAGELFFRPEDVELSDACEALSGRVTACRRLAGTRIAEIDIANDGHAPYHVEIEVPLHAPVELGSDIRFRPTRWKIFAR